MVALTVSCAASEEPPSPSPAQETLTEPVEAQAVSDAPVEIKLPGAEADVRAVATDSTGTLNPPTDIHDVGWWVDSALPGEPGTTVVTGHVNSVSEGDGFADRFPDLAVGEIVEVVEADGDTVSYRVEGTEYHNKATEFPADKLNALDGPPTLALITCGGEFVGPPWGYEDNVITWAVPIDS